MPRVHAAPFAIASGPCVATEICFRSFGYPSNNYGFHELCNIIVTGNFALSVTAFNTEDGYDRLLIAGVVYQGTSGPAGLAVSPSTNISWSSDESTSFSGFEICAVVCPAGQYGSLPNVAGCTGCENGKYSKADSTECQSTCPPGTYVGGPSICLTCPGGQFQAVPGILATCTDCEAGKYSRVDVTVCSICAAGSYQPSAGKSICKLCAPGTQSSAGAAVCSDCPEGRYSTATGSAICSNCPAGYSSPLSSLASGQCSRCQMGQYSQGAGTSCADCPAGTYLSIVGATTAADCTRCPVGTFSVNPKASVSASCILCPKGAYSDVTGATSCLSCPAGMYQGNAGSDECLSCPGNDPLTTGNDKCFIVPCLSGKFGPSAESCSLCPNGKFSPQATQGATFCSDCEMGKYSSSGASACTPCSAGTYQIQYGSPGCTMCQPGSSSVSIGASFNVCTLCAAGTFQDVPGAITCVSCNAGNFSTRGAVSCSTCIPGRSSGANAIACSPCIVGHFAALAGSESCPGCEVGKFSPSTESTTCTTCSVGQSQGGSGQATCVPCAAGQFTNDAGSASCKECALGRTSTLGSSACALAGPGRYLDVSVPLSPTVPDYPCPLNSECQGQDTLPQPKKGSWISHSELKHAATVYLCERETCQGAVKGSDCWNRASFFTPACQDSTLTCKEGSLGPLCGSCMDGFTYSSSLRVCTTCADWTVSVVITSGALVCIGFLGYVSNKCPRRLPLSIIVSWSLAIVKHIDMAKYKILWSTVRHAFIKIFFFVIGAISKNWHIFILIGTVSGQPFLDLERCLAAAFSRVPKSTLSFIF